MRMIGPEGGSTRLIWKRCCWRGCPGRLGWNNGRLPFSHWRCGRKLGGVR
jgi:hypothetical protein